MSSPFYEEPGQPRPTIGDQMPPRYTVRSTAINTDELEAIYDDLNVVLQHLQNRDTDGAEELVLDLRDRVYRYLP